MQVEIALASSLRRYTKKLLCAKLYVAGNRIQVKVQRRTLLEKPK